MFVISINAYSLSSKEEAKEDGSDCLLCCSGNTCLGGLGSEALSNSSLTYLRVYRRFVQRIVGPELKHNL
jgi:hypothetical protein